MDENNKNKERPDQKEQAKILEVECIVCKHFFGCTGKERKGQLCIRFEERGGSTWQSTESRN